MYSTHTQAGSIHADIGTGRGGDLADFRNRAMKKVYAIDPWPRDVDFKEFKKRVEQGGYDDLVSPVKAAIEETDVVKKKINPCDSISAFSSLTFLAIKTEEKGMKALDKFNAFADSLDHMMKKDTVFFGTVLDGENVAQLLYSADGKGKKTFSTPAWEIEQKSKFSRAYEMNSVNIKGTVHENSKMMMPNYKAYEFYKTSKICEIEGIEYKKGMDKDELIARMALSNKIESNIIDRSSMVHQVTEGLFPLFHMTAVLQSKGISPVAVKKFTVEGYSRLPTASKIWADLNTMFCYSRNPEKTVAEPAAYYSYSDPMADIITRHAKVPPSLQRGPMRVLRKMKEGKMVVMPNPTIERQRAEMLKQETRMRAKERASKIAERERQLEQLRAIIKAGGADFDPEKAGLDPQMMALYRQEGALTHSQVPTSYADRVAIGKEARKALKRQKHKTGFEAAYEELESFKPAKKTKAPSEQKMAEDLARELEEELSREMKIDEEEKEGEQEEKEEESREEELPVDTDDEGMDYGEGGDDEDAHAGDDQ
jgi:hypothetical protein